MRDNIIDIIMDYSVNEGMNRIILEDEEYIGIQKEIDEQILIGGMAARITRQQRNRLQSIEIKYNQSVSILSDLSSFF